jgi:ketosteroid isomerase-like protein
MPYISMHRARAMAAVVLVAACVLVPTACTRHTTATTSRPASTDSVEVSAAAARFLAAFDSLQWEPFSAAMSSETTVFMPGATHPPQRLDGRDQVLAEFRKFFAGAREQASKDGRTNAPFLGIGTRARDLLVQVIAPGAAVGSFHLGSGATPPSRRSVVFRRERDGVWRIVHWHASSAPTPAR